MKIFTFTCQAYSTKGTLQEGVVVETFTLKSGVKVPAILLGETGRGRSLKIVPVKLMDNTLKIFEEQGKCELTNAVIGQTQAGNIKLCEIPSEQEKDEKAIFVLKPNLLDREFYSFTGDYYQVTIGDSENSFMRSIAEDTVDAIKKYFGTIEKDPELEKVFNSKKLREMLPEDFYAIKDKLFEGLSRYCDSQKEKLSDHSSYTRRNISALLQYLATPTTKINPLPGEILAEGHAANGIAGRMAHTAHYMIILSPGETVRIKGPETNFIHWTGQKALLTTLTERENFDTLPYSEEYVKTKLEAAKACKEILDFKTDLMSKYEKTNLDNQLNASSKIAL